MHGHGANPCFEWTWTPSLPDGSHHARLRRPDEARLPGGGGRQRALLSGGRTERRPVFGQRRKLEVGEAPRAEFARGGLGLEGRLLCCGRGPKQHAKKKGSKGG